MKISSRYTFYSLIASAVPLGLAVLILFFLTHRELEKMRADDRRFVEHLAKSSLDSFEENVSSKLRIVSGDLEWTTLLLKENSKGEIDQLALIDKTTSYKEIVDLSYLELISADSILIARSGDYSSFDIKIRRPGLGKPDTSYLMSGFASLDMAGDEAIYAIASVPIFYKGDHIAFLQGGKELDKAFLSSLQLLTGATLEMSCPLGASVSGAKTASGNHASQAPYSHDFKMGIPTFGGRGDIVLTVRLPKSNAENLLAKSLWLYAIVALGGIVLAGIIGYISSRHLTVPIEQLAEAADEIADGKFERRIIWFANDELGRLVEGFNTMYDRLKRSQERLVQSEKIAAWNQMARKVAHEIKNPLTPIQVSVEDLKLSYDSGNPEFGEILNEAVDTISSEIANLRRLTDEFSHFARLPAPIRERKDIRPVVADALRIYTDHIKCGRLRVRFPQSEIPVNVDAGLFSQVMVNLVKNALEASGADGLVTVTGELGESIVRVVVEDDGPGVTDDHVAKLFTPYFTTKEGGTGLGLAIAYRIIFDHGGRMRYEKGRTKGARFIVVLPLAEGRS